MDDDTLVVVKTFNGPEGSLVLFNELFCYKLALLIDLNMPNSGVCVIDDNTEVYNDCVEKQQFGYGFYSTYLNKTVVLNNNIINKIRNLDEFYKILLFDHIIYNKDRNPGNLLVQYYKKDVTLRIIDHSHVFVNEAIWDAACLQRAQEEKDYFSTRILEENSYLYSMFVKRLKLKEECFLPVSDVIRSRFTEENMRKIVDEIPKEWIPSEKNINALIGYIRYRVAHLDDICITILDYYRKKGGSLCIKSSMLL